MMGRVLSIVGIVLSAMGLVAGSVAGAGESTFARDREKMVRLQIEQRGICDPAVLKAMRTVLRHKLVPEKLVHKAYRDQPLPIGHGQTISQPYIVALMTELLDLEPTDSVLEVGTGSGYQAAVLGQIVRNVFTIEIIAPLAEQAKRHLSQLGYNNITVLHKDGYFGHADAAPYDAIIVTAAATHIPPPLIAQLKPGGRMVIPVGSSGWTQNLILLTKDREGKVFTQGMLPVRFVPLTRKVR